jgi:hypothetical protein
VVAGSDAWENWVTDFIDGCDEVVSVITLPGYAFTNCVALSGATRLTPLALLPVTLIPSDATAIALAVFHWFKVSVF